MKRKLAWAALLVYSAVMLWLLLGQRIGQNAEAQLQLQPLETVLRFWRVLRDSNDSENLLHAWSNLAGNVVLFVPLGFLVPWMWQPWRRFWRHILLMGGIILMVELSQLLLALGTCDVDDLLLNLLGSSMGFLVWKMNEKLRRQ